MQPRLYIPNTNAREIINLIALPLCTSLTFLFPLNFRAQKISFSSTQPTLLDRTSQIYSSFHECVGGKKKMLWKRTTVKPCTRQKARKMQEKRGGENHEERRLCMRTVEREGWEKICLLSLAFFFSFFHFHFFFHRANGTFFKANLFSADALIFKRRSSFFVEIFAWGRRQRRIIVSSCFFAVSWVSVPRQ